MRETEISDEFLKKKYGLIDNRDWQIAKARQELRAKTKWENELIKLEYRPLDFRFGYFSEVTMDYPRKELKKHLQNRENWCLNIVRQTKMDFWGHVIVSKLPTPALFVEIKDGSNVFPLYLYPETNAQEAIVSDGKRTPNLNAKIVNQIAEKLGSKFTNERETTNGTFAPIDILDYIYAVLHSPTYRDKFKEFLKIDFPRVAYPKDADTFWQLVKLGGELRQIHLLESPVVNKFITTYPVNGSNEVAKLSYVDGKVWINSDQYFDHVSRVAWEFYIGGYQPAQKWLKDRKGRVLSFDDIMHYQKIIVALAETNRLMKEIDVIEIYV